MKKLSCLALLSLVVGCGGSAPDAGNSSLSQHDNATAPNPVKADAGSPAPVSTAATPMPSAAPTMAPNAPMADAGAPIPSTPDSGSMGIVADSGSAPILTADAMPVEAPCQAEATKCVMCDPNHSCVGNDQINPADPMYAQRRYVVLHCDTMGNWQSGAHCDATDIAYLIAPACAPIGEPGVVQSVDHPTYTLLGQSANQVECVKGGHPSLCTTNVAGDSVCR